MYIVCPWSHEHSAVHALPAPAPAVKLPLCQRRRICPIHGVPSELVIAIAHVMRHTRKYASVTLQLIG